MVGSSSRKRVHGVDEVHTDAKKPKVQQTFLSAPPKALRNDEIADQIKQMFAAEGFTEKPTNCFDMISNNLFDRIMKHLTVEEGYSAIYKEYEAEWSKKKKANKKFRPRRSLDSRTFFLKRFYQLQFVDRRFAGYFDRRIKDLPKVDIGVRIQHKLEKIRKDHSLPNPDEGKVVYNIHNGAGIIAPTVCDFLNNIDYVLRFGLISSHFDVFGLPLDNSLLDAIKKIDTSHVSSAYFYNIPYVDFEGDVQKKAEELVALFPNATVVDFHGTGFDPIDVFGNNTDDESELIRKDVELHPSRMVASCLQITASRRSRKGRGLAKRAKIHSMKVRTEVAVENFLKLGTDFAHFEAGDFSEGSTSPRWSPIGSPYAFPSPTYEPSESEDGNEYIPFPPLNPLEWNDSD